MPAPVSLTHPRAFKAQPKSLKGLGDMNERISARVDNRLLKAESVLVDQVANDEVSLEQFQSRVDTFRQTAVKHAQLRPGGVSKAEFSILGEQLKQEPEEKRPNVSSESKALFRGLQDGSIKIQEAVEELHWKSQQSYGQEVSRRDGTIFKDERSKLRAHLFTGKSVKAEDEKELFVHQNLKKFVSDIETVFPKLDQNEDGMVDRTEARKIINDYQRLGLSPATATTFYSRQSEIASIHDSQPGEWKVSKDDLQALVPENHLPDASKEFNDAVTRISKRLDFEEGRESPEASPFVLEPAFQPMNVKQGREGSCWVLCNLPNLGPEEIANVIQPEGDQYRVKLSDGRTTLVDELNEAERRIYSHGDGSWSGLLEKGVSQILADDNRNITGGPAAEAREFLTGQKVKQKTLLSRDRDHSAPEFRDRKVLFQQMESVLESGGAVFASALPEDFEKGISEISVAGHAYTVLSLEQDKVELRNAWGRGEIADRDGENDGRFTLTKDQFFANFSLLDIG